MHTLGREIAHALNVLDPWRMNVVVIPSEQFTSSAPEGYVTVRGYIVEALRHAAIHLGELRLTRSLLLAAG